MTLDEIRKNPNLLGRLDASGRRSFYKQGFKGKGTLVAVIDGGIKPIPEAFGTRIINAGEPVTGWHGTAVANIVAGAEGIAPEADILAVTLCANHTLIDVAAGIRTALKWSVTNNRKIDVMCICISGTGNFTDLQQACKEAWNAGTLIVCSSGNTEVNDIRFPGAYAETLCVGSVDNLQQYSKFESYGQMLDVVQYGELIPTLCLDGSYAYQTGTSFSTPIVAGIALLKVQQFKQVMGTAPSVSFLKDFLMSSVIDLGVIGEDNFYGKGFCTLDYQRWVTTELYINKPVMYVNGSPVTLDQPPVILAGRTMLPVRAIAETLTQKVTWSESEQKVTLEGIRL